MEWIDCNNELPETNEKWSESDYCLVLNNNNGDLGTAWYNSKSKEWFLSHSLTPNIAITVTHWCHIPEPPKTI